MFSIPTLVSLLLLAVPKAVYADPCVAFDSDFNLYAFGLNGKDWNAGSQDSWTSGSAKDITATGRPPFDGANTTCYLAQFFNAIYVLNGDQSNPSDVYIYDATAKSWSTQTVTTGSFDPSSFQAILDHDTNVFFALSHGELWSLDMGTMVAANSSSIAWLDNEASPYPSTYQPVMAIAQNHVHFLDVPGVAAGSADIFVIHFSFFQPDAQAYPGVDGGATFPATHGQTTSFFQPSDVQQEFAFIPDDGSMTYVINVETNTTSTLPGPTSKDANARYAAGITSLVQLDSAGAVSFIAYTQGDAATNAKATWAAVANIASVAPASTTAGSSGTATGASATGGSAVGTKATGTSGASTGTSTGGASATGAAGNGALVNVAGLGSIAGAMLAVFALL